MGNLGANPKEPTLKEPMETAMHVEALPLSPPVSPQGADSLCAMIARESTRRLASAADRRKESEPKRGIG
jgi:hypothetical protein